ncbi:MAG: hypothetical protein GX195_01495, partial [Firmicutes bacterium]|nr:hypothetical protein [Bacillota bacterium]
STELRRQPATTLPNRAGTAEQTKLKGRMLLHHTITGRADMPQASQTNTGLVFPAMRQLNRD